MGVLYYINSVALVEDLGLDEHFKNAEDFYAAADQAYSRVMSLAFKTAISWAISVFSSLSLPLQTAYNCWIAACIYVLTLLFAGQQFYANSRVSA